MLGCSVTEFIDDPHASQQLGEPAGTDLDRFILKEIRVDLMALPLPSKPARFRDVEVPDSWVAGGGFHPVIRSDGPKTEQLRSWPGSETERLPSWTTGVCGVG